ncbi:DUF1232 domain-containing protein [Lewinella sp. W8]|uniref:YkvA family protein n=1 Tax=Lewinella sp. W8 TaxID=2528208 RepID=UPI0010685834|nr:DUF1232 domain-containing protein [Lewinella sp. W8]
MKKLDKYRKHFSEFAFWDKLKKYAQAAGIKVVYSALLLYYAYQRSDTPSWAKRTVVGTLGYLIAPIDFIPDLGFLIGYTDDMAILSFCLVTIAAFVNEEVRGNAREKLGQWFDSVDETALSEVDEKL